MILPAALALSVTFTILSYFGNETGLVIIFFSGIFRIDVLTTNATKNPICCEFLLNPYRILLSVYSFLLAIAFDEL